LSEHKRKFQEDLRTLEQLSLPQELQQKIDHEKPLIEEYLRLADVAFPKSRKKDRRPQGQLPENFRTQFSKVEEAMADAGDAIQTAGEQLDATSKKTVTESQRFVGAVVFVGVVLLLIATRFVVHSVVSPMREMANCARAIAQGDLATTNLETASEDELGDLARAVQEMQVNLRELIQSIAGTAEHVASASEELSSSATLQAQGADTQRDQTAQVATAMQEMSSTVLQVSENSGKAAEASRKAAETARQGGIIVDETLRKMRAIADSVSSTAKKVEELGKSSDQIGRIIGVIDDIADQTNLLALNAAIEAARAGEQGRGFAVVADEVRKLAERTTTATKEIAQMIQTVQSETKMAVTAMEEGTKQVEEGVKTTTQAGDALKEIISMSENVGEMITHIATAATEQSSATEEINNNMEQISKLVKESADGAQQSAKACQDLSGLAMDLQKMVGNFKVKELPASQNHSKNQQRLVLPVVRQSRTLAATAN
jgi:methyl-accepting chemotaxis protein